MTTTFTNITANIFFLCGIISFKKNPANMYASKIKNRVFFEKSEKAKNFTETLFQLP